jgi:hypothetical protein
MLGEILYIFKQVKTLVDKLRPPPQMPEQDRAFQSILAAAFPDIKPERNKRQRSTDATKDCQSTGFSLVGCSSHTATTGKAVLVEAVEKRKW